MLGHETAEADDLRTALEIFVRDLREVVDIERVLWAVRVGDHAFKTTITWDQDGSTHSPEETAHITSVDEIDELLISKAVAIDDLSLAPQPALDRLRDSGMRSLVAIPLITGGEVRAVLTFASRTPEYFDVRAVTFLRAAVREVCGSLSALLLLERERTIVAKLRAVDEIRDEFMATVAHDIRSPLAAILGYADLLERRWPMLDDEQRSQMLRRIRSSVARMNDLIGDVMEVSRIDSEHVEFNPRPVDLLSLVKGAVDAVGPDDGRVSIRADAYLPCAFADDVSVARVMNDLISNATRFSPCGAPISITIEQQGRELRVGVHDRGSGISADDMPLLFQRFARLPRSASEVAGTGLGLYICKNLVEMHGGRIWADSTAGQGSSFWFTLPVASEVEHALRGRAV